MNAYQLKPKSKRNPVFQQAYEQGKQAGYQEATDIFHKFLNERMQTISEIPGIGEKTAWKVHEHFLKGMEESK